MRRWCVMLGTTLLCITALWLPAAAVAAIPVVTEIPICTAMGDQLYPAISGAKVVWVDQRDYTIRGYDLVTRSEFLVSPGASGGPTGPAMASNTVVWADSSFDIYGRDLVSGTTFPVCTEAHEQWHPAIAGDTVVWQDYRSGANTDIYARDISLGPEFPVCTAAGLQRQPDISGDIVVWSDNRNGNYDIYGYDLGSKTEFPVCTATGDQAWPAVDGQTVVWRDRRNGKNSVYAYSLTTKSESLISATAWGAGEWGPDLSGNTLVWTDARAGRLDTYGYDLSSKTTFLISAGKQGAPAISGDTVVWFDGRNPDPSEAGNADIYGAKLSEATDLLSTTCTYVFAPDARSGWHNTGQTVGLTASGGTAPRTIHYSTDGGSTWTTSAGDVANVVVASEGAHRFLFWASDSAVSEAIHDAGYVNIDQVGPTSKATATSVKAGRTVTLKFRVNDVAPTCGKAVVKIQIRKRLKVVKTISLGTKTCNAALTYRYRAKLAKGIYTWRVLATDIAGNKATKMTTARLTVK